MEMVFSVDMDRPLQECVRIGREIRERVREHKDRTNLPGPLQVRLVGKTIVEGMLRLTYLVCSCQDEYVSY